MPDVSIPPDDTSRRRSQQPFPVWCGLTCSSWLRLLAQRPAVHWSRWNRLALVSLASGVNSLLALAERAVYSNRIAHVPLEHPPVFILGHWRSGTSLLHTLLASDPQFAAPTLYQTSFPSHFLLTERWFTRVTARLLPPTRPMDNMPYAWDAPGEDEIALLLLTLKSPYLLAAFPDAPQKIARFESLSSGLTPSELKEWKKQFLWFLRKVTLRTPKPLVLKSPTHTGRIRLLLSIFPQARFIHIVRNPYEVFSSTLHLQRVLLRENSFGRAEPLDLEERVFSTYLNLYQAYHLYRPLIPPSQLIELRFEDLISDRLRELQRIYAHFGFDGGDQLAERLEPELNRQRTYRRNEYELDEACRQRIAERWRVAFRRYGYPM